MTPVQLFGVCLIWSGFVNALLCVQIRKMMTRIKELEHIVSFLNIQDAFEEVTREAK